MSHCLTGQPIDLQALLRPVLFLPESITALAAIEQLKAAHTDVAVVIDEYAGFQGILTVDDILEELVSLRREGSQVLLRTWVGGDKDGHPGVGPDEARASTAHDLELTRLKPLFP